MSGNSAYIEKLQNNKNSLIKTVSIVFVILCAVVIIYCLFKAQVSCFDILSFIIITLFYILLPGYTLARKVADTSSSSQIFAFSILFSFAFLVLFYFIDEALIKSAYLNVLTNAANSCSSIGLTFFSYALNNSLLFACFGGPVLSVVSIVFIVRDFKRCRLTINSLRVDWSLLAMIMVMMVFAFGSIYLNSSLSPKLTGDASVYPDVLWMTSNDAALANGWPADGFQYYGKYLNSNIGADLVRAMITRISGISAAKVYGIFSTFITIPFVSFSIHALGEFWTKNKKKALFFTFSFLLVCFFSLAFLHLNDIVAAGNAAKNAYFFSAMVNISYCPNGIDIAIPALALSAIIIIKTFKEKRLNFISVVSLVLAICTLTMGKYVFTVCLIIALVVAFFIFIFQKRGYKNIIRILLIGIIVIVSFGAVYLSVTSGGQVYRPATAVEPLYEDDAQYETYLIDEYVYDHKYSEFQVGANVGKTELFNVVQDGLKVPDSFHEVLMIVLTPVQYVLQLFLVGIPFILFIVAKLKRLKEISFCDLLACGIAISGLTFYYALSIDGLSQVYFFFCASVFVHLLGSIWIYDNFHKMRKVWKICVIAAVLIGLISTLSIGALRSKHGYKQVLINIENNITEESTPGFDKITDYEYEAMIWLRDNTPDDAVIAVDRHYSTGNVDNLIPEPNQVESRYYYYTAYSERQTFLGSWSYLPRTAQMQRDLVERLIVNDALYSRKCLNRREIMEKNNISYVVVSRFINPGCVLTDDDFEVVYMNRDIKIYALR